MSTLKEALEYFKSKKGYKRVFNYLYEKYRSYERIGGEILLENASPDEKEVLSGLLKKDYSNKKDLSFKYRDFQKAFKNTRFKDVDIEDLISAYFGLKLVSKKEEIQILDDKKSALIAEVLQNFKDTSSNNLFKEFYENDEATRVLISRRFNENSVSLKNDLFFVLDALNKLPSKREEETLRLAVFSTHITKNPHSFDQGSSSGTLLEHFLARLFSFATVKNALERATLLYQAGLIVDDVSSNCLLSGVVAKKSTDYHLGFEGFYKEKEPFIITMNSLRNIDSIISPAAKVFVFENPSVFTTVYENTKTEFPALICSNGQLNLATMLVLEHLSKSGTQIYYSGDFDPEGLLIAQQLKIKFKDSLVLWRYDIENYEKALSNEKLDSTRLKKLKNIKETSLLEVSEAILISGFAGYQEALIKELIMDIV